MIKGPYVLSNSGFGVSTWYMQSYEEIDLWYKFHLLLIIFPELCKVQKVQFKFRALNSEANAKSVDKMWAPTIELFWTEFKVNSERVEWHHLLKREGATEFCVSLTTRKKPSSSFLQGGTPLSLNWLWAQFIKVQRWLEQQFKFLWNELNLKWPLSSWKKTELNGELQSSSEVQFSSEYFLLPRWLYITRRQASIGNPK